MDNFENTLNLILDVAYQSDLRVYDVAYAEINRSNIVDLKHTLKTVYDLACGEQQHRIDGLQKSIDDLKSFCIKGVESNMLSFEYNQALIDMHNILKGNKDEI